MTSSEDPLLSELDGSDWPLYGLVDDVRPALQSLLSRGQPAALITLVAVDGPSPRPVGSQMIISDSGHAAGYVSGGCVEGSLGHIAQEVITAAKYRKVIFGANSPYFDVKLICGSQIELIIEPILTTDQTWGAILSQMRARQPIVRTLDKEGVATVYRPVSKIALCEDQKDYCYTRLYEPTNRLFVFGADPVALALAQLGQSVGFEIVLVRPFGPQIAPSLGAFGYYHGSLNNFFAANNLDQWTAIVTTTHDLDHDHEVLIKALQSDAFYVGALGSRKRRGGRLEKLAEAGLASAAAAKLNAPVGLDIGATTPLQIAIAILADIIKSKPRVQSPA